MTHPNQPKLNLPTFYHISDIEKFVKAIEKQSAVAGQRIGQFICNTYKIEDEELDAKLWNSTREDQVIDALYNHFIADQGY